ncbi:MAG TPA: methyltransferase domain-containing protein [Verrucomicrobiae bacterium]|nr:methyltransferase domain-containing protein [Verrucomicrobiae bacterium]
MRKFLLRLKAGTVELNYGRDALAKYVLEIAADKNHLRILDIGLGAGKDLVNIRERCLKAFPHLKLELFGLECYPPNVEAARKQGIQVSSLNVENEEFPFEDGYFDIVLSNQILEHTKEVYWIFSEISRIVKPQGFVLTGVPNLASFHNRVALAFGLQPTAIQVLGPHVRGFTAPGFIEFVETDGFFVNKDVKGSNFYPFPPYISRILSRLFPLMSVGIFFKTQRTSKPGVFIEVLRSRFFETPFFAGPEQSTPRKSRKETEKLSPTDPVGLGLNA